MVNFLLYLVGCIIIAFLFILQDTFGKPIYNKASNVYEDDEHGRIISRFLIIIIICLSFFMGLLMQ
jgi:hypothetical protein